MKNVDVIIPVYNAIEYTKDCITTILKYTDLSKNSLVLINDKSPDENVLQMLMDFKNSNKDKNIIVLENEENLGFVKTVNKGMKYSSNDVILLNSDTEVTKNWIEKLQECAYSNEYIATATPLTNNGTICSVPNFGIDNEIPKGFSIDEYAKMIEETSISRYPQLTTGNGFCMFIKREVLDKIGYFDDVTFDKGYGEENDFCYRALDNGYTNVLCDNLFIYHKGSQSFTKENLSYTKASIINEHMNLLRGKYPIYVQKTDNFIANNPLNDIQENVHLNILLHNKKKILYLVNEWNQNMEMTAGTSLHIKDLILANLKNNIASFVLVPDAGDLQRFKLYLYVDDFQNEIANYKTDVGNYGQLKFTNNRYREMLENIFSCFKFDILHVHHFLFQTFDAIDVAKKYNIYSIITLHDLYMMCPSINMIYKDIYCKFDNSKDCLKCLKSKLGLNNDVLNSWQENACKVLKKFDKVIVPSENTKKLFNEVYNDLDIEVVEHGIDYKKYENTRTFEPNNEFNVAFVGAMAIHKGSLILKDLIKKTSDQTIKIHLFGKAEDKDLIRNKSNYINHGSYRRGELPELLIKNKIDLVCIFATCPETYSYTLTETYMAKVPVLAFDIGAVGDRVKSDNTGWTIDLTKDTTKILEKINYIKNSKKEYLEKKESFESYKFKSVEEMQDYYEKIYENITAKNENSDVYSFIDYRIQTTKVDFDQYLALYSHVVRRYEKMRSSKVWKIAKKIKRKLKNK